MNDKGWLFYAIGAAVSAAFVGIFAKVGMSKLIDPTVATTVRSLIMLLILTVVCTFQGLWVHLPQIRGRAVVMIALSGLAGAISWLCGFKAYALGEVSQVAPIDKLSVPLAALLAFFLLRDRPSLVNWAGIILIAFGAYLASVPRPKVGALANESAIPLQSQRIEK